MSTPPRLMTPEEAARVTIARAQTIGARVEIATEGGLQFSTTQLQWIARYCSELRKAGISYTVSEGSKQ